MSKGISLPDIAPIAIAMVIAGIVLGLGSAVLQYSSNSVASESVAVLNESLSLTADSRKAVVAFGVVPGASNEGTTSITYIMNATTPAIGGNATKCGNDASSFCNLKTASCDYGGGLCNYTYNATHMNASVNGSGFISTGWLVTYTWANNYTKADQAYSNSTLGLGQLAYWMPTIGLVVAAAIIIGVVFSAFMKKNE